RPRGSAREALQVGERVDEVVALADRDGEVQVGAGRLTRRPDEPDEVADLDLVADGEWRRGALHVRVSAVHGLAVDGVLDDDEVAPARSAAAVLDDDPVGDREDRGTRAGVEVDAGVRGRAPAAGSGAVAEPAGDRNRIGERPAHG